MREYIFKQELSNYKKNTSVGAIGEQVFKNYFLQNFNNEQIFKQNADRDFNGIDFVCEKGFKYQVKCTRKKTYTFNCDVSNIEKHLRCDYYVFVQLIDNYAYIEKIRDKSYVLNNIEKSYNYNNCFVRIQNLKQYKLL